jgi:predicted transcriptional regulator
MRLGEIMTTNVRAVGPREDAELVYQKMRRERIRHLVVKSGQRVIGVIGVRELGGRGAPPRKGRVVSELMVPTLSATPKMSLRQAAHLLRARTIGCLPIVENSKLLGIVTLTDVLELLGKGNRVPGNLLGSWQPGHSSKPKPTLRLARATSDPGD